MLGLLPIILIGLLAVSSVSGLILGGVAVAQTETDYGEQIEQLNQTLSADMAGMNYTLNALSLTTWNNFTAVWNAINTLNSTWVTEQELDLKLTNYVTLTRLLTEYSTNTTVTSYIINKLLPYELKELSVEEQIEQCRELFANTYIMWDDNVGCLCGTTQFDVSPENCNGW